MKRCYVCKREVADEQALPIKIRHSDEMITDEFVCDDERCKLALMWATAYKQFSDDYDARLSDRLKPCPFCGGDAELLEYEFLDKPQYIIRCESCECEAEPEVICRDKARAIEIWNNRVNVRKGEWHRPDWCGASCLWVCSECGISGYHREKFCPNCGAKMNVSEIPTD